MRAQNYKEAVKAIVGPTLQYLFFENVVLKYDPLSIQEVKYLLYLKFRPLLIQLGF